MLASGVPPKFPIPWGNAATGGFIRPIPEASQIGIQAGAASLTDGFPPITFDQVGAGGVPAWGADLNGILKQLTQYAQWQAAGGPFKFDSGFATAIGGYPAGCIIASATLGQFWVSQVDSNTNDPDAGGAGWLIFASGASSTTVAGTNVTYTNDAVGKNTVRSNGGAIMVDTLPGTSPGILRSGGYVTITNNDPTGVLAINAGAGATLQNASSTGYIYLGPKQAATFLVTGIDYWPVQLPNRCVLGGVTSFFIAPTGSGSPTNHGLTSGSPLNTRQTFVDLMYRNFDIGGTGRTLVANCLAGTFTDTVTLNGPMPGQTGPGSLIFKGAGTTTIFNNSGGNSFEANNGAMYQVQDYSGGAGGNFLEANFNSIVGLSGVQRYIVTGGAHIASNTGSQVLMSGSTYTIAGSCAFHWLSTLGGKIIADNCAITLTGTPAWGVSFTDTDAAAFLHAVNTTFSGAATGTKFIGSLNSVIETQGGYLNFPGNAGGGVATGAQVQ